MIGYKLFRKRKDGSYGPLFIDCKLRLEAGVIYPAKDVPTKGYAHRPGWHICKSPNAPHLSKKDRVWVKVWFSEYEVLQRPEKQGGVWYLAKQLKLLKEIP